jgi:hypothetical protein
MSEANLRNFLQAQISERAYIDSWSGTPPSYPAFLDYTSARLARSLPDLIQDLTASIRSDGNQRVRIDGSFSGESQTLAFYTEVVWLPSSKTFRGNVNVTETQPEPPRKTVSQFIKELDCIRDEQEIIFVGQVLNAVEGLDENDADIPRSYPAIFRLFERLPEEDFGNPGFLIHLILSHRGHETLLAKSIRLVPSIPTLYLAYELAVNAQSQAKRTRWIKVVQRVASCDDVSAIVREYAQGLLGQKI